MRKLCRYSECVWYSARVMQRSPHSHPFHFEWSMNSLSYRVDKLRNSDSWYDGSPASRILRQKKRIIVSFERFISCLNMGVIFFMFSTAFCQFLQLLYAVTKYSVTSDMWTGSSPNLSHIRKYIFAVHWRISWRIICNKRVDFTWFQLTICKYAVSEHIVARVCTVLNTSAIWLEFLTKGKALIDVWL